jgi:hypothetical protein
MSPRLLRVLVPVLLLVTTCFALYQLFLAGVSLRVKSYPAAALYAGMGVAGLAIVSAMARSYKRGRE